MKPMPPERHFITRIGWLRAAVLGANDGILSTASLILGVAAASSTRANVLVAGLAGLVAGAMSMAAGEYVSVSSQADTEHADLTREAAELAADPAAEQRELASIYIQRGVAPDLAAQVAAQLMRKDALGAHAQDELGISASTIARPIQAALTSAATFSVGAVVPLLLFLILPPPLRIHGVWAGALAFLGVLGGIGAHMGGASIPRGVLRVTFWGALAMVVTAGIGAAFGTVVG